MAIKIQTEHAESLEILPAPENRKITKIYICKIIITYKA
jgi:hypothetical protein